MKINKSVPWENGCYQLISLWEIMQKLQTCAHDMGKFISGLVSSFAVYAKLQISVHNNLREITNVWLASFEPQAKELGLELSLKSIRRAQKVLRDGPSLEVANALNEICNIMIDELKSKKFLYIEPKYVHYYEDDQLFGQDIINKIPLAIEDIQEAGKCFALQRFTACVFHLMRIMERTVQELGNKLGVAPIFTYNEDWQKIINAIQGRLNTIYGKHGDPERLKYEIILGHLQTIKLAWRNPTMHPKATYTEEEAKAIIDAVEIFLKELIKIL